MIQRSTVAQRQAPQAANIASIWASTPQSMCALSCPFPLTSIARERASKRDLGRFSFTVLRFSRICLQGAQRLRRAWCKSRVPDPVARIRCTWTGPRVPGAPAHAWGSLQLYSFCARPAAKYGVYCGYTCWGVGGRRRGVGLRAGESRVARQWRRVAQPAATWP